MWKLKTYISFTCFVILLNTISTAQTNGFIQNKGQVVDQKGNQNAEVKFILSLSDYNVSFYQDHISYEVYSHSEQDSNSLDVERIELWFENYNPNVTIDPKGKVNEKINYYKNGNAYLDINQYQNITYNNVWEGIDIEFLIFEGKLKYNYIVRNNKIKKIDLTVKGATPSILQKSIKLEAHNNVIEEAIPESFFLLSNNQKKSIDIDIAIKENKISYLLPKNREKTLIIDPIAYNNQYTSYYGGSHMDFAHNILHTKSNNIVVTGYTVSTNNIATTGAYQATLTDQDAFIASFDQNGIRQWATYFGGTYQERIYSAALDTNDNIFIAGNTTSLIGISTPGANQTNLSSGDDAFITQFSSTGSLIWSSYYGGDDHELITAISIDDSNKVYVTGHTSSTDLPCTPNAYRNTLSGYENAFLGVFDNAGNVIYNSYYIKGSNTRGEGISITADGTVYIAGYTNDSEVSPFSNIHQSQNGGYLDGFILKINSQYQTVWKTYFGGEHNDLIESIDIDENENLYLIGKSKSIGGIATASAYQPSYSNSNTWDGFAIQLDSSSNQQWGTYINAGGDEDITTIKYQNNSLWVLGMTDGTALTTDPTSLQQSINGGYDNIILNFSLTGNLLWSTYFGGSNDEFGYDIDLTNNNKILITGQTGTSSNFVTSNAHQNTYGGHIYDGFWSILCQPISPTILSQNSTLTICEGDSVEVSSTNNFNSYLWSSGETSNSIYISTTGNYVLETIDNNNCPGKSDTLNVVIIPNYDLDIQTSNNAICHNDSTQLSTLSNFSSYTWSNGETTDQIYINDNQEYYLSVINSFGCEYFSDTISLPVSQYEYQIHLIGDTLICAGGSSILHTDMSNSVVWNTTATTNSISISSSGDYSFSGIDSYGCPIVSDTVSINQISYNTPSLVLDTLSSFLICWDDSITLTAENDFDSYLWSNGETSQSTTISNEGYYYISATDSNGCVGISDSIQLIYKTSGKSIVHASNGVSFCEEDSLLIQTDPNLTNILWNNSSTLESIYILNGGVYSYTAIDDSGCLSISDTLQLVENSLPIVGINSISQDSVCLGDSLFLTSSTSLNQYSWSNGSTLSGSFFNFNTLGYNTFYLDGTDQNNCQNTDSIAILIVDCNAYDAITENEAAFSLYTKENQIEVKSTALIKNVELLNITGQLVYSKQNVFSKEFMFETTTINTGVYIIRLTLESNFKVLSRKINIYSQ